jgi:hypothetical protein
MRIAEIKSRTESGGVTEAAVRSLLYVGMKRGGADERSLEALRRLRGNDESRLTLSQFKALVREQFFLLLLDEDAALEAIPKMLPVDRDERRKALAGISQVLSATGEVSGEAGERFRRVVRLFDAGEPDVVSTTRTNRAKAS